MNFRCRERVKIGSVGMLSSERVSSSEEFVEVRLGMAPTLVGCCTLHVCIGAPAKISANLYHNVYGVGGHGTTCEPVGRGRV